MSVTEANKTWAIDYPDLMNKAVVSEQMHWHELEADLQEDLRQWRDGTITDAEKSLITEIMKTFTQSDVEVAKGYSDFFLPTFQNLSVTHMLISFLARECIHQRAYAMFVDTVGLPMDSFSVFQEYGELVERLEEMTNMDVSTTPGIARAVARTVVSEGVCLFGAFAILLNFQRYGKLRGLCTINEWSIKDENLHVEGMVQLFQKFVEENPDAVTDRLKADIYQMFRDAVELEDKFIDLAFKNCYDGIEGLEASEVKAYIRYLADRRLIQLGLKGNYNVRDNPLPWISNIIGGANHTNFFEQRVTDYAAGGLTGEWGWE